MLGSIPGVGAAKFMHDTEGLVGSCSDRAKQNLGGEWTLLYCTIEIVPFLCNTSQIVRAITESPGHEFKPHVCH